jgi:hypothetical protein
MNCTKLVLAQKNFTFKMIHQTDAAYLDFTPTPVDRET